MKTINYNFDMFIGYGLAVSDNIVDGMPWSFDFFGYPVTHENNDQYIISLEQPTTFSRGETIESDGRTIIAIRKALSVSLKEANEIMNKQHPEATYDTKSEEAINLK